MYCQRRARGGDRSEARQDHFFSLYSLRGWLDILCAPDNSVGPELFDLEVEKSILFMLVLTICN